MDKSGTSEREQPDRVLAGTATCVDQPDKAYVSEEEIFHDCSEYYFNVPVNEILFQCFPPVDVHIKSNSEQELPGNRVDDSVFDKPEADLSLVDELLLFMIIFNISHSAMHYLLKLLNKHGVKLPFSVYSLKKIVMNPCLLR